MEAMKQEKLRRRQDTALTSAASKLAVDEDDPLAGYYGDITMEFLQSKTMDPSAWTRVVNLEKSLEGKHVLIRARVEAIRRVGKKMALLVVREKGFTVQCLVQEQRDLGSVQMVKYAAALSRESVIDVEGLVSVPSEAIKGATQQVEVQVRKLYCVLKLRRLFRLVNNLFVLIRIHV